MNGPCIYAQISRGDAVGVFMVSVLRIAPVSLAVATLDNFKSVSQSINQSTPLRIQISCEEKV